MLRQKDHKFKANLDYKTLSKKQTKMADTESERGL
jgi:hypothetical protein